MRVRWTVVLAAVWVLGAADRALAQAAFRAVFVGHYYFNSQTQEGGSVASLRVNGDGSLTLMGNAPSGAWTQSIALSPSGRWLAAAAGTSSTTVEEFRVFEVGEDARLTLRFQGVVPDSPLAMAWLTDDLIAVTATQTTGSSVGVYRWTPPPAGPSLVQQDRRTTGVFNAYLAYHPSLPYLYTQDTTGGNVVKRWQVDFSAANYGRLTAAGSTPVQPNYPLGLATDRAGRRLYAGGGASGDRHAVLGFRLGTGEEALPALPGMPYSSPGNSPAWLSPSGDDRFLVIGHGTDATVRTFWMAEDGVLAATGASFQVQNLTGAIGEVAVLKDLVFVTDDTSAIDGLQGIWSLRLGPAGTLTPIGGIVYTGTPRPEGGIAVWDPAWACAADYDGDAEVLPQDVAAMVGDWFEGLTTGALYADVDGNRELTPADVSAFVAAWYGAVSGGC